MTSLTARLAAATGPDRELDAAIALATRTGSFDKRLCDIPMEDAILRLKGVLAYQGDERLVDVPAVTASIDAAVALVERVLPGWHWETGADKCAMVRGPDDVDHVCWSAATPPLALLLALFEALDAKSALATKPEPPAP